MGFRVQRCFSEPEEVGLRVIGLRHEAWAQGLGSSGGGGGGADRLYDAAGRACLRLDGTTRRLRGILFRIPSEPNTL